MVKILLVHGQSESTEHQSRGCACHMAPHSFKASWLCIFLVRRAWGYLYKR